LRLALADFLLRRDVDLVLARERGLEVLDRLAHPGADLRQPSRAEDQHRDGEDDDEFAAANSKHGSTSRQKGAPRHRPGQPGGPAPYDPPAARGGRVRSSNRPAASGTERITASKRVLCPGPSFARASASALASRASRSSTADPSRRRSRSSGTPALVGTPSSG